jgi:hypothetical protein
MVPINLLETKSSQKCLILPLACFVLQVRKFHKWLYFLDMGWMAWIMVGLTILFLRHMYFSTFKGDFQSHLFQKNTFPLFFIVGKIDI